MIKKNTTKIAAILMMVGATAFGTTASFAAPDAASNATRIEALEKILITPNQFGMPVLEHAGGNQSAIYSAAVGDVILPNADHAAIIGGSGNIIGRTKKDKKESISHKSVIIGSTDSYVRGKGNVAVAGYLNNIAGRNVGIYNSHKGKAMGKDLKFSSIMATDKSSLNTDYSAILSGVSNKIKKQSKNDQNNVILGGNKNTINGGANSAILAGENATVKGNNSIAAGKASSVEGDNGLAMMGGVVSANNGIAIGEKATADTEGAIAIGAGAKTTAADPDAKQFDFLGDTLSFATRDKGHVVSIGSDTETRTLQNVSAGKISDTSTDAINGSQLHMVAKKVEGKITELEDSIGDIENNVNDVSNSVANLGNDIAQAGAHAAALSALKPLQYNPMEKTQIMAGVGRYKAKNSYALGLAVHANENLLFHGGISMARHNTMMANAGITWRVGTEEQQGAPSILKDGPISAMYRMANELSTVINENKGLREEVDTLQKKMSSMELDNRQLHDEMEEMKAQLASLMANK